MNILILTWKDIKNPKKGWAEVVIYNYAKRLAKKWHNVFWYWPTFDWAKAYEEIEWIKIIRKYTLITLFFFTPFWYKKFIKNNKIDVIIDEAWWIPLLTSLYEKKDKVVFFIHHIWDKELDYSAFFPINKILKCIYNSIIKLYKDHKTITVSNSTKEDLLRYWFKEENVTVIENWIDLNPINNIDLSKKEKAFCFVWRMMPIKRVEDIIKAFYIFLGRIKDDYKLYIVWSPQNKKYFCKLKQIVNELNLDNKVIFTGFVSSDERDNIVSKSIASLLTSYKEWFWLNVLEANAVWTTFIAYNVPWLKDSIKDWVNWYLVKESDIEGLADKMYLLATDKKILKDIITSGINYVKNYESWDKKADKLEKILVRIKTW